jgi:NifU-like protein
MAAEMPLLRQGVAATVWSSMTIAETGFSAKALGRLRDLRYVGEFTDDQASLRGLSLIDTTHGAEHATDHIRLMLLVDAGGVVRDARYRTLAVGAQLAAYDQMVELCLGRTLDEAARITPAQVDAALRDDSTTPAIPLGDDRDQPYYVLVKADERYHGKAGAGAPPAAPAPGTAQELPWTEIGLFEKVRRIESVLDQHVRPALASDGGGIDLVDLKSDELYVQYHGACGSCSSSIGGTLQFIQDSLNNYLATTLAVKVTGIDEETPFTV